MKRIPLDLYDDVPKDHGVFDIQDTDYKGKFTITFYSKDELTILQNFFGVRRNKFDMKLLLKRPNLLERLKRHEDINN